MLGGVAEVVVVGQGDRLLERPEARAPGGSGEDRSEQPICQSPPVLESDPVLPQPQPDVVLHVKGAVLPRDLGQRTTSCRLSHGWATDAPRSSIEARGLRPVRSRPITAHARLTSTPRAERARRPWRGPAGTRVPSISIAGTSSTSLR